jgi:Hsp20/alpha crystallin family protein
LTSGARSSPIHVELTRIGLLPSSSGIYKDDVSIDVTDDDLTISGERRQEEETERGGVYRSGCRRRRGR